MRKNLMLHVTGPENSLDILFKVFRVSYDQKSCSYSSSGLSTYCVPKPVLGLGYITKQDKDQYPIEPAFLGGYYLGCVSLV